MKLIPRPLIVCWTLWAFWLSIACLAAWAGAGLLCMAAAALGIVSLFAPWGRVIKRDPGAIGRLGIALHIDQAGGER
jgi:hypothetical protein